MAEATSLVPLGTSGTGKAVVLSQNIAESPMAIFKHQQRFKAAQDAAEAKAKAAKEKLLADERKDIAFSPEKTDALYQTAYNQAFDSLQSKSIELQKKYHSKGQQIPLEERLALNKMEAEVKQMKNYGDATATWLKGAAEEVLKNDDYDEAKTKQFLADYVLGEDNKPKFHDPLTLRNVTNEMMENHTLINTGKMTNRFVKQLNTAFTEKFYSDGKFDYKRAVEANAPIEYQADGVTPARDKNGNVILKVTDQLVDEAKKDETMNRYLTGMAKEQQAALERGEIDELPDIKENLSTLLESEVYAKQTGSRSRIPVKTPRAGSGTDKSPIKTKVVAGDAYAAKYTVKGKDGKPTTKESVVKAPEVFIWKDYKNKQISTTFAPETIYHLNPKDGVGRIRTGNKNSINFQLEHTFYALVAEDGRIIEPPEIATKSRAGFSEWVSRHAAKNPNKKYEVLGFAKGSVEDESKTEADYVDEEAGGEAPEKKSAFDASTSGPKQTNQSNLIPLTSTNRAELETALGNTPLFDPEVDKFMNDINSRLGSRRSNVSGGTGKKPTGIKTNAPAQPSGKSTGVNWKKIK